MKLCDTCIYGSKTEYFKPCIIYRDDCEYYEKERGDMTREEAIKEIIDMANVLQLIPNTPKGRAVSMAIQALEQEPKTGHWIIKDGKEQGYDIGGIKTWYIQIMCDKCGFIKTAIEGHTGQYHYCPNCGAKMVEPQESELENPFGDSRFGG